MDPKACIAFQNNPAINPLTGREIKKTGAVYKRLVDECERVWKAPPMGPVLHYKSGMPYGDHSNDDVEWDNTEKMAKYILARAGELQTSTGPISYMELDDLIRFGEWMTGTYEDPLMDRVSAVLPSMKALLASDRVYHDEPTQKVVIYGRTVHPSRFATRLELLNMYGWVDEIIRDLLSVPRKDVKQTHHYIRLIMNQQRYIEYIVDHRIFSKTDIESAFGHSDIFRELHDAYEHYKKWKKQAKGYSHTPSSSSTRASSSSS